MKLWRWFVRCTLLGAALAVTPSASAQPGASADEQRAQVLFDAALKLMDSGEFAPACALLEQSDMLDPGMGTRFRLAECFEKIGRVATAWRLFLDVAAAARETESTERERVARQRAAAIAPRLAKLEVQLSPDVAAAPGLVVKRDGVPLSVPLAREVTPVDPGEHVVEVSATGKNPWRGTILIDKPGRTFTLAVPALDPVRPSPAAPDARPSSRRGFVWSAQRVGAVAASALGGVGLVVGGVFGSMAASQWSDAEAGCEGERHDDCSREAIQLGEDAFASAAVSTAGFVVGAVGVAGGVVLWVTAPSEPPARTSLRLLPAAGPNGAGVVLCGAF